MVAATDERIDKSIGGGSERGDAGEIGEAEVAGPDEFVFGRVPEGERAVEDVFLNRHAGAGLNAEAEEDLFQRG